MTSEFLRIRTNGYDYIALGISAGNELYLIGYTPDTASPINLDEIEDCSEWQPFTLFRQLHDDEEIIEFVNCDESFIYDIYTDDIYSVYRDYFDGKNIIFKDDEKGFLEFKEMCMGNLWDEDDIKIEWDHGLDDTTIFGYKIFTL